MKWYKFSFLNKLVIVLAFSTIVVAVFSTKGAWDLYLYIIIGLILFLILLIDVTVQAIKDDKKQKKNK